MRQKLSDYVADFLVSVGVSDLFMITGGGAMHLNDSFGHCAGIHCVFNHHEQACAIAAESYTRTTGKLAAVCVTSGPGGTNALTGVLGGWLDSIPMFIISGQVKRETTVWSTDVPLRQIGDQEFPIVSCVRSMTKYAHMVTQPDEIRYHLEKAWYLCRHGRGGPVWLDIPLDVQGAVIETKDLKGFDSAEAEVSECPVYDETLSGRILDKLANAQRPVLFAGTGIRLSGAYEEFLKLVDKLKIPVVTAWNAHDVLWNEHPYYCGRPGTLGTRGGNFVVENADVLFVIGCRLNIRQISYNYKEFAEKAYKIIVDIDGAELRKPTIHPDLPVHADAADVMRSLNGKEYRAVCPERHSEWLAWCRQTDRRYPALLPQYFAKNKPLNPYVFMDRLFQKLEEGDQVVCSNGSACVISFQTAFIKKNQRLFTNSGCAAMGYGLPAAIGAAVSRGGKRVICLEGDGSLQMNIQELQTVVYNRLNIKLIVLNNNGYHSIRQTQTNLFEPPMVGVCDGNGLSFPSMERIAYAYELPYVKVEDIAGMDERLEEFLGMEGPAVCEAVVDPDQFFAPKLSSRVLPDGKIVSPKIDDMFPFLDRQEYESNKLQ